MQSSFFSDLLVLRSQSPLVYNLTNTVAASFTANALLALGASPIMSNAIKEADELCDASASLVLNIGTLDDNQLHLMRYAGQRMHTLKRPIILDPVGAGATTYRTDAAQELIRICHPTIIRGNANEISSLVNPSLCSSHGVDATISSSAAVESAKTLSLQTNAIVVISGQSDYITDGHITEVVTGGTVLQTRITAMGCTATAITAAFAAIQPDPMRACVDAMQVMSLAAERAQERTQGPGTLAAAFIDELYLLGLTK